MTPHQKVTITRYYESDGAQMGVANLRQIGLVEGTSASKSANCMEGSVADEFGFQCLADLGISTGVVGGYVY